MRLGSAFFIAAGRAATENDADDAVVSKDFRGDVGREDQGMHLILADAAGNELHILRAEIKNCDGWKSHAESLRIPRATAKLLRFAHSETALVGEMTAHSRSRL